MVLPPEPREARLVFWLLLHRGRGRGSSFVFYFAWLSRNHWLLKMVWLWETLNLGRVSLPPFGACTVYQDFSLSRHNVKDTMEQYTMLQHSRRSGAPWTVLWQWVEFTQAGGKTVNVVCSLWTWTGSHQSWSSSCWDRKEYIQHTFVPEITSVCRNCAIIPGTAGAVGATWLSFLWSIVICQDPFDFFRAQTGELNRPW